MWPPDFQYQEPHWQGCIVSSNAVSSTLTTKRLIPDLRSVYYMINENKKNARCDEINSEKLNSIRSN